MSEEKDYKTGKLSHLKLEGNKYSLDLRCDQWAGEHSGVFWYKGLGKIEASETDELILFTYCTRNFASSEFTSEQINNLPGCIVHIGPDRFDLVDSILEDKKNDFHDKICEAIIATITKNTDDRLLVQHCCQFRFRFSDLVKFGFLPELALLA